MDTNSLVGKVALVTGASRGIGRATAYALAARGADVAITFKNSAGAADDVVADIMRSGGKAMAVRLDLSTAEAIASTVDHVAEAMGGLDILVNNAGIAGFGPLDTVSVTQLNETMHTHVHASFLASQAAAGHMGEGGRIISIGSCLADYVGGTDMTLYATSKAALSGMTRGLAHDLGQRGITVNLVQPGPTATDMNPIDGPASEYQAQGTALKRFAQPEEIAAVVQFLAGPGSSYITGAIIAVDGGANA